MPKQTQPQRHPPESTAVTLPNPSEASSSSKKRTRTIDPEEIGIELKRKLTLPFDTPARPGVGTLGKRIKLISNCFPLNIPSGYVYHYDVEITKEENKKKKKSQSTVSDLVHADDKKYRCLNSKQNRKIIQLLISTSPLFNNSSYPAYDGQKNLYTRNPLQASFPVKCEVILPDDNCDPEFPVQDTFKVKIKPVNKEDGTYAINLDSIHFFYEKRTNVIPPETVMALETILRHGPCLDFTPIGRSFFYFPEPGKTVLLGSGLEAWFGHHQSIRLGQWGPMVNLNVTATTFSKDGPLISYIASCLNVRVGDLRRINLMPNSDIKKLNNRLKNMKIEVTHLNYKRKYRIFKLVKQNACHLEFKMTDNGRTITKTVAAYFRERYNKVLQFPNLPCIQVYPENRNSYLPIEVCEIIRGQHSRNPLEPRQNSEMIKNTAIAPSDRFKRIRETVNSIVLKDKTVQAFGLEVSQEPLHVEARVLDSPLMQYKPNTIKPVDGIWDMRPTGAKFYIGAAIQSWVLLSFTAMDANILKQFSRQLVDMGKKIGMSINSPRLIETIDVSKCDINGLLFNMKDKYQANLAVIIIRGNEKDVYAKIKKTSETSIGLVTQCVKDSNVKDPRKCLPAFFYNLCQKINTKTGGTNSSLVGQEIPDVLRKPVIIIGADVNHAGPTAGLKPSLAACIGSLDAKLARYAVSVRAQVNVDEKKQSIEIILELKEMVRELLLAFYESTRKYKPEKIIFYRDGVSEGQFETVKDYEVRAIRLACKSLSASYEPGLTFILVQKRHHTRFMPEDSKDAVGAHKNVPPGTTVDTGVTDPCKFDFYLCSHFGLKGENSKKNLIFFL